MVFLPLLLYRIYFLFSRDVLPVYYTLACGGFFSVVVVSNIFFILAGCFASLLHTSVWCFFLIMGMSIVHGVVSIVVFIVKLFISNVGCVVHGVYSLHGVVIYSLLCCICRSIECILFFVDNGHLLESVQISRLLC